MTIPRFFIWFVVGSIVILGLSWLFFDESMAQFVLEWRDQSSSSYVYSMVVITVLSADLLLPIPSSAVMTHAGQTLGVFTGTIVTLFGLTIGSCVGYALARWLGESVVLRSVREFDQITLQRLIDKNGVLVLVLLRPVPILAEASVLLLGLGKMNFGQFLFWLTISNLAICLFFTKWGAWAAEQNIPEIVSLLISIAIPLVLLFVSKLLIPKRDTSEASPTKA